jgi:hypothetical protein
MNDPYAYRARLTLPKLLGLATNDEYYPTDALNLNRKIVARTAPVCRNPVVRTAVSCDMETLPRTFKPRFAPRDVYDRRLSALALVLLLPPLTGLAVLWSFGIPFLAYQISGNTFVSGTCFWMAWLLWIAYFLLIGVYKVEVGATGLRYWRGLRVRTIAWQNVEAIEQVPRRDIFRLFFSPSLATGRIAAPGSLTLSGYLCVRHKQGVLLFPPEDAAEFLNSVRAARTAHADEAAHVGRIASAMNASLGEQVPGAQGAPGTSKVPWYHSAYALREENQTTIKNRTDSF